MKKLTAEQISYIMDPLRQAEFDAENVVCPDCEGDGEREYYTTPRLYRDPQVDYETEILECDTCEGAGFVPRALPDDGGEFGLEGMS